MELEVIEKNMRNACQKIQETGKAHAIASGLSYLLREQRKSVLADMTNQCEGSSMAEREMLARCTSVYKEHLEKTSKAIENEIIARAIYKKWECVHESLRSIGGWERAKIQIL